MGRVFSSTAADDKSISSDLVIQANLPTAPLSSSKDVFALDGQLLNKVTQRTILVILHLSGNHTEILISFVIPFPISSISLSLPCLQLQNPHIDWVTAAVVNWSIFCPSHYLLSGIFWQVPPFPVRKQFIILVPLNYYKINQVYNKGLAIT